MKVDDQILDLHRQGLVTGAIAVKLCVESAYVRQVIRTHLEVLETSKPSYSKAERKRRSLEAKVTKAQTALDRAAVELRKLNQL